MQDIAKKGLMFILSSPSGAGKTTLSKALIKAFDDLIMSISITTRTKRPNETDGIDYFFTDKDQYQQMIDNHQLLEHAKVFDQYYGTPKEFVLKNLERGIDVLFDVDWQGTKAIIEQFPQDVVSIYILPPSIKELNNRLKNRAQESDEVINLRMSKARSEISHWHMYDYIIINENLEQSLMEIACILRAERLKRIRQVGMENFVDLLLKGN
jgi:guanylate kinase